MNTDFNVASIQFSVGKKKIEFKIYHNLPETKGLSFQNAFDSWVNRTDEYTDESLCDYINDKNTGYLVFTEKEWEVLNKE